MKSRIEYKTRILGKQRLLPVCYVLDVISRHYFQLTDLYVFKLHNYLRLFFFLFFFSSSFLFSSFLFLSSSHRLIGDSIVLSS